MGSGAGNVLTQGFVSEAITLGVTLARGVFLLF